MIAQLDKSFIRLRPFKVWTRFVSYILFEGRPLTTKGRWFNPVLLGLQGIYKRIPAPITVKEPIFIVGTGRSGTTILGQILGIHKNIGFLNEPKAMWYMINPDEDLVGNYSTVAARYRLTMGDATPCMVETAQRLYSWYQTIGFCSRVLDKYPELVFRVPFVQKIFPDAKFLLLVRDGWDTCCSIDRWSDQHTLRTRAEVHDWWGRDKRKWEYLVKQVVSADIYLKEHVKEIEAFKDQRFMAAVEWALSMKEGIAQQERIPESMMMIRYESLVKDPVSVLDKIQEFCNLQHDPVVNEYANKILKPAEKKGSFVMPAYLKDYFDDVMTLLGYGKTQS